MMAASSGFLLIAQTAFGMGMGSSSITALDTTAIEQWRDGEMGWRVGGTASVAYLLLARPNSNELWGDLSSSES